MTPVDAHIKKPPSLRYAWYVVVLLMLANISSFLDRQILALLVMPIKRDLNLTDTQVSLLMGISFAIFYTLFGIIIGRMADSTNRRNTIIAGITAWSIMTALCAGIKNYTQFFLARMGVGVGEAALSPSAYSIITDYFPKRKLALAMSIFTMGIFVGSGFALAIGAGLVANLPASGMVQVPVFGEIYPWQLLFLYIGMPGLVIALLLLTIKEPERKDVLLKNGQRSELSLKQALAIVFRYPKAYLGICIGTAFTAFVMYGTIAWIPTYFARTFGWSVPKAGLSFGLVLCAASVTGVLWGGWYADRLKNSGIANGRVRIGFITAIAMCLCCFIPLLDQPIPILALLFIPVFFLASPMGACTTAIQELMPNQVRALASAIFLFMLNMIGLGLGPTLVALCNDYIFHDENAIRYSMTILYLSGGLLALTFYSVAMKAYVKAMNDKEKSLKEESPTYLSPALK